MQKIIIAVKSWTVYIYVCMYMSQSRERKAKLAILKGCPGTTTPLAIKNIHAKLHCSKNHWANTIWYWYRK